MFPEIILGPPGTGKTTTLLNIVETELSRGVPPEKIAYVSFTRRASEEAVERACQKFGFSRVQFPYFRTIHSLCFHALGLRSSEVFQGLKLQEFAKWIGIKVTGRWSDDGTFTGFAEGDRILFLENLARVKNVPLRTLYNKLNDELRWSEVERVVKGLRIFKEEQQLFDFTDMLEQFIMRGHKPNLDILLCDEVQDQSALQWQVIEKIAIGTSRVVVAGDDDQGVYEWSGGDIERIIYQPGKVTVLEQSYRVPSNIQNLANNIIQRVKLRRSKEWNPREGIGIITRISSFREADLTGDDILILARNNFLLKDIVEPELRRNGIIYSHNDHLSVKESMLKAIQDWEKLRAGEFISLSAALNLYEYLTSQISIKRGFKKLPGFNTEDEVDMKKLQQDGGLLVESTKIWHEVLDRIPEEDKRYILAARHRGERLLTKPRVRISSIHGAKGSQANHVILLKEMAKKTFKELERNLDAEARVFYTGVTRAKERLTIVESSNNRSYPFI